MWGPAHAEVAGSLVNLGLIVRRLGDNTAAAAHYMRAVAILLKALGLDDPIVKPFLEDQRKLRQRARR